MKKAVYILFIGSILISCQLDDFYDTKRYFKTGKSEYKIGDDIELTAIIKPEREQKTIRFYENFKNLKISFTLMNSSMNLHNSEWTKWTGQNLPNTEIEEHSITQENPFQKTYKIRIREEGDSVILSIPEMNYRVPFDSKLVLDKNTKVRIHGFCDPINPEVGASLEEYFEVRDIKIIK